VSQDKEKKEADDGGGGNNMATAQACLPGKSAHRLPHNFSGFDGVLA